MTKQLVLTFIGEDKPGLVERLSEAVREHHGNWLESRMAHLADKFAGILTVSVPEEHEASLISALQTFDQLGLNVIVESAKVVAEKGKIISLSVVGNDKPGIVKEVTQILHSLMINIKELSSTCEPAPMSSEMLFKADMVLHIPSDLAFLDLEEALEGIGSDLMIELEEST